MNAALKAHHDYAAVTARMLARIAHAGQADKFNGEPYVLHLERVADLVEEPEAKIVAWLHDIIEDTEVTEEFLRRLFSNRVVDAVKLLTRDGVLPYQAYIVNIRASENPLAIAVKIADLKDHLRPESRARSLSVCALGHDRPGNAALETFQNRP